MSGRWTLLAWMVAGCGPDDRDPGARPRPSEETTGTPPTEPTTPEAPGPTYELLAPVERLVRASLDLRGVRPTPEEIAEIEANPGAVPELVARFVYDDPRFVDRVSWMSADVFWTYDDAPWVKLYYFDDYYGLPTLARAVGEEPMRMFARIAAEDLPLSELVTADWTMANSVLADIWPVEPSDAGGWYLSRYTDGRPAAGLLALNSVWWHHGSMENNLNRERANYASRVLLCHDYLDLEVDFGTDQPLNSDEALGDAVRSDPNCTVCHDTLDPLASHFFGFWFFSARKAQADDISTYHPDREREWVNYDMPAPGFGGVPTSGLADLGREIAASPRFAQCFVEHGWRMLLHRSPEPEEQVLVEQQTTVFQDAGLRLRPMFEAIATSDAYSDGASRFGRKVADAALLSTMIEDLTGYTLTVADFDLIRSPYSGFGELLAAVDGETRFHPVEVPDTTYTLVTKRLAEAAATFVVGHDLANPQAARLLTMVDGTEQLDADRERIAAQLVALHLRVLSERIDTENLRIEEELELWGRVHELTGQTDTAWIAVVSLLLRDPRFLVY